MTTPAEGALASLAQHVDGTEPCRSDPEMWFADPGTVESRDAKALCNGTPRRYADPTDTPRPCPMRERCYLAGLLAATHGVWGGQDEHDLAAIRERHNLPAPDMGLRGSYDV